MPLSFKSARRFITPLAAILLPPVVCADVTKANNTTALNVGTSYVGGIVPSNTDVIIYDATVAAANSTALGGSLNVLGLRILNPGGAVTIGATSGATLTLGASGIDMSTATQDLTISAALALGTAQNWNVVARTLTVSSALADGGNALTFTGTGNYRGGINNAFGTGTLNLSNNLTLATNDGTGRNFGNTAINFGGNITFGQTTGGTGALTFNGAGAIFDLGAATRTFTVNQTTTFNGTLQSATAGVGITKAGGGILSIASPATYSGTTSVNNGVLRLNAALATNLPNSNTVFGGSNSFLQSSVAAMPITLGTGVGQLQFGAFNSGFSATTVNSTFTLNGGAPLTWAEPFFIPNNQSLLFGSTGASQTAILANNLDLGATAGTNGTVRTIAPTDNGAAFEGEIAGTLNGVAGLVVSGSGALKLSGASVAVQGGTFVNNGVLGYDEASLVAPANLPTGPIGTVVSSLPPGLTSAAVAYTGAASTIPSSFYSSISNFGSAITVAGFGGNNASGNYATAVDFSLAPAAIQSKLYLGSTAASGSTGTAGITTLTGALTPVGGKYRLGGGSGVLSFGTANQLTGANDVVVRTGGVVRINNVAQDLTGTISVDGGIFELHGTEAEISTASGIVVNGVGSLANATSVNGYGVSTAFFARLRGGVLGLQNLKDAAGDLIGSQVVVLRGGAIVGHDNDNTAGTILVQNVIADNGYTQIAHQPQGGATARDQLTLTNLTRNTGATVEFRSQFGALSTASGDNGNINVTNVNGSPIANTNNILGGWAVASSATAGQTNNNDAVNFATQTANGVAQYTQEFATAAGNLLSAAGATSNVLATGSTNNSVLAQNTISASQTINSLITESAVNVTNGATLTLASGGLIMRTNQNFFQSSTNDGKLTSGLSSGELFLYSTGAIDTRITSIAIVDNGATPVGLVKGGTGSITFGGLNQNNTFSGPIVVNLGTLRFDYRGTGSVLPSGAGNTITARAGGTFSTALNVSAPQTVSNNVTLDGGTLANDLTGGGTGATVTYTGTIAVSSVAGSSAVIASNAAGSGLNIGDIVLAPGSTLSGAGNLTKAGSRALDIQTPNTTGFTGSVFVTNGAFQASGDGILPNTDYVITGGSLGVTTTNQTIKNLTGTGGAVAGTSGGTDSLTVVQDVDAAFHGQITNTLLIKQGDAHLYLSGGTDNSSGNVRLDAGILTFAKASTNAVHVVGSGGVGLTVNGGVLRLGGSYSNTGGGAPNLPPTGAPANYVDQIYYATEVVFNGGVFDLNGLSESVDGLSGGASAVLTNTVPSTTSTLFTGQDNAGGNFAGTMQDGAGVFAYTKLGSGTQTLSGANTFTGPTEVRGGTLSVTGSLTGSVVTVEAGATLIGDGPIGGLVLETGANVAPGVSSIATLAVAGAVDLGGGTLALSLDGTGAGTTYDQLSATGNVTLSSDTTLTLALGFTPTAFVDSFTILDNLGANPIGGPGLFMVNGTPLADDQTFALGGFEFRIQYDGGTGNDVVLETIPEPMTGTVLLSGLACLASVRRRRRA